MIGVANVMVYLDCNMQKTLRSKLYVLQVLGVGSSFLLAQVPSQV
jgi:hypothetical protein